MSAMLNRIIANAIKLSPEQITPDFAMADVPAWDSLAHMELIVSLEEHFGIVLTPDEIVAMTSVAGIKQVLNNKGVAGEWS